MARRRTTTTEQTDMTSARISPLTRFAADLVCLIEKRSLASLIEIALLEHARTARYRTERWLDVLPDGRITQSSGAAQDLSVSQIVASVWSPNEARRVTKLGVLFPGLLNEEQSQAWEIILRDARFWRDNARTEPNLDEIERQWHVIRHKAAGEACEYLAPPRELEASAA
jgi:hypothetical protein